MSEQQYSTIIDYSATAGQQVTII